MKSEKEYNYIYEDGKVVRATEYDIVLNEDEFIIGKTVVTTVMYTYDSEGKLTRKRFLPTEGKEQTIYYETAQEDNMVVKFTAGKRTVTSHSKNDAFGRKVFDELQFETGFASRQFSYHVGQVTDTHVEGEKLKSAPTTQLVERIILSDGRILSYEYDKEERITKVTDSIEGVTEYTYDALGQLLTETQNGDLVNTMTYDNYGNILTKNGEKYTYGDVAWRDRLTAVDGKLITYDAQGNPINYFGYELTWEKGRQLKSFEQNTYTYNANGIRTSKTVNGVTHTYTLDGTNILKETWGDNELLPMYDNEDNVCGIIYNDSPFYFLKNLQGDVIAIIDKSGKTVAGYSYDAWGVCTIKSDTSGCNIAMINPYRYRGYYYDTEIGMYYLQSRYYDPSVGRFVNGDVPEILAIPHKNKHWCEENLFSYCNNNLVGYADYNGQDAIWITDMSGLSHTSLLIENNRQQWHYFYWGSGKIPFPLWTPNFFLEKISTNNIINKKKKTLSLSKLNNVLRSLKGCKKYSGTYDKYFYISGNFYASISLFNRIKNSKINKVLPTYNAFSVNCVWMSIELLRAGAISYWKKIYLRNLQYSIKGKRFLVPSVTHWTVRAIF